MNIKEVLTLAVDCAASLEGCTPNVILTKLDAKDPIIEKLVADLCWICIKEHVFQGNNTLH